jgi:2-keto-4-pentenoate hydratase
MCSEVLMMTNLQKEPEATNLAEALFSDIRSGKAVDCPISFIPAMTLDQAYTHQEAYVRCLTATTGGIIGYKAATTNPAVQEKFGIMHPTFGVLTRAMRIDPLEKIRLSLFHRLLIEIEIALWLKKDVTGPLSDEKEAARHVRAAAPAVELPDLPLKDPAAANGLDLVALNIFARGFMVGAPIQDFTAIDQIETKLFKEETLIDQGRSSNVLGNPLRVLVWMSRELPERGHALKAGQVVLTGATGGITPAAAGSYRAEYGAFGAIDFQVVD